MAIQWFPGHMHLTRKAIGERIKDIDVVIELLDARYKLGLDAAAIAAKHDDELLELIARKRGAVMSGGRLNLQKAAEIVLTDLRSAALGRVTLETPAEFEAWLAAAEVQEKERAARKAEQLRRNERRARNAPRDED